MPSHITHARTLRSQMTAAERHLWAVLRRRQRLGRKFRRQPPIGALTVDFACFDPLLVVEVDGPHHDLTHAADTRRDSLLRARGFTVLRFSNEDVLKNREGVVATIEAALRTLGAE